MIPISKDQKLKCEIDGVTYSFHPPVGDLEIKLQEYLSKDDGSNITKAKALYPEAIKQLEKEYKGKKKPPKVQFNKLIEGKLTELMEESGISETDVQDGIDEANNLVDLVLCGWVSKIEGVPEFPVEKPSQYLTTPLKNKLMSWYWTQYTTTEDELKNL